MQAREIKTRTGSLRIDGAAHPSSGQVLTATSDRTRADWQTPTSGADPRVETVWFREMMNGNPNVEGYLTNNSGGSADGTIAGDANHIGLMRLYVQTSGQRAGIKFSDACIRFGKAEFDDEVAARVLNLSDGTDTFTVYLGFIDSATGDATDGVYWRYSHGINGGKWQCVTRSNSSESTADSGAAVVANTWYRLRIVVNAAGTSAAFYVDDSLVATITTNIPTAAGRETSWQARIEKSAGSNWRHMQVDWHKQVVRWGSGVRLGSGW